MTKPKKCVIIKMKSAKFMKNQPKNQRIPLMPVFEYLFGIKDIKTPEGLRELIKKLRALPDDTVIDFSKMVIDTPKPNRPPTEDETFEDAMLEASKKTPE